MVAKFHNKVSLGGCLKRANESQDLLVNGKASFRNILETQLLGNYYMLDLKIGRSNKLAEFARADLINYQKIKKFILKQMYVCAFLSKSEDSKMLTCSILQELLRGTDNTQLTSQEVSKIPFEYIRQVCFLSTPEADEDYGEEAIIEQNNLLHRTYAQKQAERYEQLLKLYVGQIKSGHTKISILRR